MEGDKQKEWRITLFSRQPIYCLVDDDLTAKALNESCCSAISNEVIWILMSR